MVPGSTLMYGSSFTIAILRPRASRMAPSEAAAMPFPNEETTPPVTNTNLVMREPADEEKNHDRRAGRLTETQYGDMENGDIPIFRNGK